MVSQVQETINRLITDVFPRCKDELTEATTLSGLQDPELWVMYRNAMDRVLTAQRNLLINENIDFDETLKAAEYQFHNLAVESWVKTANFYIGLLELRLDSGEYGGSIDLARMHLRSAMHAKEECRKKRSESYIEALANAKKAAQEAIQGLDKMQKIPRLQTLNIWLFFVNVGLAILNTVLVLLHLH
jgi:hypothetical protein